MVKQQEQSCNRICPPVVHECLTHGPVKSVLLCGLARTRVVLIREKLEEIIARAKYYPDTHQTSPTLRGLENT